MTYNDKASIRSYEPSDPVIASGQNSSMVPLGSLYKKTTIGSGEYIPPYNKENRRHRKFINA